MGRPKLFAGTEPSHLFVSRDGGKTWQELQALLALPSYPDWRFPPRPWTSDVHSIAPSPHDAGLLLVGIELGGLIRSIDGGELPSRRMALTVAPDRSPDPFD